MTTVAQKLLNIAASPIGSLEWGSHRVELGLGGHIFSEKPLGQPETVRIRDPITSRSKTVTFPSPVIYGLKDVTFHPGLGVIRAGGIPIRESLPYYYAGPFLRTRGRIPSTRDTDVDATAFTLQTNYFHFLIEDLPRLLLLRRERGIKRIYSGRVKTPAFILEILDLVEIEVVFVNRIKSFKKLWFVGKLGEGLAPTQLAVQLLRESFRSPEKGGTRRLYISRKGAQRDFFDESVLESALNLDGIESVAFEKMRFLEQVEMVANASLIVGPHGAGLANQVFLPNGSSVLEVSSHSYANPVFEVLAGDRLGFERVLVGAKDSDFKKIQRSVWDAISRLEQQGEAR